MTQTATMFDAIQACQTIRAALSMPRQPVEPTTTLRGCMVDNLEHLFYREHLNKYLRYRVALFVLKLIR